jgi:hypothetical protein
MVQTAHSIDRSNLENLLAQNKLADALALLCRGAHQTAERETHLYTLLVKMRLHGPEDYEQSIDALRALADPTDHEKTLMRRIFLYAFQMAEKAGQEDKRRVYQRLLRRLLLGQPLDQPIPLTRRAPARRIIELDAAAIVLTPLQNDLKKNRSAARAGRRWNRARRLALEFCAIGLLMMPLPYLAERIVSAPAYRSDAIPTQANRSAVSESEDGGAKEVVAARIRAGFDEAQIRESLAKQLSGLRRAYARWNAGNHNAAGSVSLQLTIDNKGKVIAVDGFDSHFSEPGFIPLVVAEARKWRFPAGSAEMNELIVPLLFVPKTLGVGRALTPQGDSKLERAGTIEKPDPLRRTARKMGAANFVDAVTEPPLETIGGSNSNPVERLEQGKLDYVAQRTITIREAPDFASQGIEEIGGGTPIAVVEVVGDWFKVRTAHSRVAGFVRKEFIVPVSLTP